jgi:hypothetical protein
MQTSSGSQRANFERQAAQDGFHHLACQVEGCPTLIGCRLIWSTRIPETPGILGQRVSPAHEFR